MKKHFVFLCLFAGLGCDGQPVDVPRCTQCGQVELIYLRSSAKGPVNKILVDHYAKQLRDEFGLRVRVHDSIGIPKEAFHAERKQHDADRINELLSKQFINKDTNKKGTLVLALTNSDLYMKSSSDWNFVYGARRYAKNRRDGVGVVSSFQMRGPNASNRIRTMASKYIALISCNMAPSPNSKQVTYSMIRSSRDLDNMQPKVCQKVP